MFTVGDIVRVLYPFSDTFGGTYAVVSVQVDVSSTAYFLEGIEGAFDAMYLELVV